ncbi:hypothetical protein EJ05DRAFT_478465 [Pseudovirgaria hyperparasitica]|uniref:Uncharacterized protein n=1 Tax=Pseudovirgaria hyperparasitica TaxID=470096 RepID=A0A6A6W0D9_9PEZI|nr:uncharacterized protein EJ05DRAFT_478465 [Pseudovirgaria hyperparasitica]KAF2755454.1 hypothetical protein EJ05DRAFT_478465 [Pseudovirgaria hyperparasitica]
MEAVLWWSPSIYAYVAGIMSAADSHPTQGGPGVLNECFDCTDCNAIQTTGNYVLIEQIDDSIQARYDTIRREATRRDADSQDETKPSRC